MRLLDLPSVDICPPPLAAHAPIYRHGTWLRLGGGPDHRKCLTSVCVRLFSLLVVTAARYEMSL